MSTEDWSDIAAKNNECVLHRWIKNEFVFVFITYYTFDINLMAFCRFTIGAVLYKKAVPVM